MHFLKRKYKENLTMVAWKHQQMKYSVNCICAAVIFEFDFLSKWARCRTYFFFFQINLFFHFWTLLCLVNFVKLRLSWIAHYLSSLSLFSSFCMAAFLMLWTNSQRYQIWSNVKVQLDWPKCFGKCQKRLDMYDWSR